jgi:DNA-directed RNA polymerase sigma subunit (sigma70/sigma32)
MEYIKKLQALQKRNAEIVRKRKAGMTLGRIAKAFGISRQRVAQIIEQAARIADN